MKDKIEKLIQQKISMWEEENEIAGADRLWNKLNTSLNNDVKTKSKSTYYLSAAAVLLIIICFAITITYTNTDKHSLKTAANKSSPEQNTPVQKQEPVPAIHGQTASTQQSKTTIHLKQVHKPSLRKAGADKDSRLAYDCGKEFTETKYRTDDATAACYINNPDQNLYCY